MSLFKKGDTVRVSQDNYTEAGSRDFTGEVGQVHAANSRGVTITGLAPNSSQPYWFETSEVERA